MISYLPYIWSERLKILPTMSFKAKQFSAGKEDVVFTEPKTTRYDYIITLQVKKKQNKKTCVVFFFYYNFVRRKGHFSHHPQ